MDSRDVVVGRLSLLEHPGVAGLIALAGREKAAKLLAPLLLRGGALGRLNVLGAALRGHDGSEVDELLGLQCEDLVAGLCRLQRTRRRLARCHQRRHRGAVGVEVADNAGLNLEGVLERRDGVLPTLARAATLNFAWLFLFHPSGYIREAALDSIVTPPTSAFFFAALAWRLNDWAGPVRKAAERCAVRVMN